ncbi:MAG: hypothetical protein ACREJA_02950 [Candidatus Methylomirabilales bacterium]
MRSVVRILLVLMVFVMTVRAAPNTGGPIRVDCKVPSAEVPNWLTVEDVEVAFVSGGPVKLIVERYAWARREGSKPRGEGLEVPMMRNAERLGFAWAQPGNRFFFEIVSIYKVAGTDTPTFTNFVQGVAEFQPDAKLALALAGTLCDAKGERETYETSASLSLPRGLLEFLDVVYPTIDTRKPLASAYAAWAKGLGATAAIEPRIQVVVQGPSGNFRAFYIKDLPIGDVAKQTFPLGPLN